jgi:hypothetical protein
VLRAVVVIRHADARRLRLLALEVFFLGTAMMIPVAGGAPMPVCTKDTRARKSPGQGERL